MDIIAERGLSDDRWGAVLAILYEVSDEFVPPLSERSSAYGDPVSADGSVEAYLASIEHLTFVYAVQGDAIIGLAAYDGSRCDMEDVGECAYIAVSAVRRPYRGHGVAKALYAHAIASAYEAGADQVLVRTWSTNRSNLAALAKSGFIACKRIVDERGSGIDTVYMVKRLS